MGVNGRETQIAVDGEAKMLLERRGVGQARRSHVLKYALLKLRVLLDVDAMNVSSDQGTTNMVAS